MLSQISNKENKYTINKEPSAALLYKLLMQMAIIDKRTKTYKFRTSLNNLSTYIGTINLDIELFNHHVKHATKGLSSRGEFVNDLPMKLSQGYTSTLETKKLTTSTKRGSDAWMEARVLNQKN